MLTLLALLGCGNECAPGLVWADGRCVTDVSDRTQFSRGDTGEFHPPDPDTGTIDTGPTDTAPPDLDGDGWPDAVDCDDDDAAVHPGAEERCDYVDNDCDGAIDEVDATDTGADTAAGDTGHDTGTPDPDAPKVLYADTDADSWGDPDVSTRSCFGIFGYVDRAGDCDDSDPGVWPGAIDRCDGTDDDCDGVVDEDDSADAATWYGDTDTDGYGDPDTTAVACAAPSGFVADDTDCDDADASVNPGATEISANGKDDDCDGGSNGHGLDGTRPLSDAGTILYGADAGTYAGVAFSESTDLDGDGAADLAIGAPFADDGAPGGGAIFVVSRATLGSVSLATATVSRSGTTAYDAVGTALVVADLDGDGDDDLAVGAPGDDGGGADAGTVWLLSGPFSGTAAIAGTEADGTVGEGLGRTLAAGDVDGDGADEVLAGAPFSDADGTDAGAAWLLSGTGTRLARWGGDASRDEAGTALAMGDVDGDGLADLAIAAPDADASAGAVYLLLADGLPGALADADAIFAGADAGDRAGDALALADLDGDGAPDLVIGAPDAALGAPLAGAVYVVTAPAVSASLSGVSSRLLGDEAGQHVGDALAAGGDVDGDGQPDLLAGASESDAAGSDAGEALVHLGVVTPTTMAFDGRLQGTSASAYAGCAVGFATDPFGYGFDDALVGAYGFDRGGFAAGAVYRMAGGSL